MTTLSAAFTRASTGTVPPLIATTATTDARHFVRHGIPAVCFGPRGERIHGIDERVSLRSLMESAQVLGLFIRDWCGLTEAVQRRREPMSVAQTAPPAAPTESAKLHRRALGVPDLVFFIVAASAPLTAVAGGQAATYLVTGTRASPSCSSRSGSCSRCSRSATPR